jgi:hypothetical protein
MSSLIARSAIPATVEGHGAAIQDFRGPESLQSSKKPQIGERICE